MCVKIHEKNRFYFDAVIMLNIINIGITRNIKDIYLIPYFTFDGRQQNHRFSDFQNIVGILISIVGTQFTANNCFSERRRKNLN